ncbi:hypothetical protein [Lentisalinibacter sediminis]|uniref:hypothetical protein n=1 Tax=Lentisalinibacter sediminis TaxID=2992237 RepID=UPI0038631524
MNNVNNAVCLVLVTALLVCVPAAAQPDDGGLLKDASFERKLPADEGGWDLFEISMFSKNHARSGSQSLFNGGFSRTVPYNPFFLGNASGAFQEFPADPGSQWRLTGYGLTARPLIGTPAFGILQLSFFDAGGEDLGTVETADADTKAKASNQINNQSAVGEWIFLDTGVVTAPAGTATVQAFTLYVDYSGSDRTQGVYFDDLTLYAVDGDEEAKASGSATP